MTDHDAHYADSQEPRDRTGETDRCLLCETNGDWE